MIPVNVKRRTKEAYSRILLNKTTTTFFVFTFVLCLAQGIIQSFLFSLDSEYKSLLYDTIQTVNPQALQKITEIQSEIHVQVIQLSLCNDVPTNEQRRQQNCTIILDTGRPAPLSPDADQTVTIMDQIAFDRDTNTVTVKDNVSKIRVVTKSCAQTLLYAYQTIRNFSSEDLTFILLQFWLLGISVLAVINDSVPHLWTVLMTRALMTAWSIYSLWRTRNFAIIFRKLYADPGAPCLIDFFSLYLGPRVAYEIPDLVLNVIGLGITCWLSWDLLRMYNSQALRYVGAPEHINRINKLFLAVLSCLQLEVFILVTAMGLWVDVLKNTAIQKISLHTPAYLGVFISTAVILVPWITIGWYSIKREMKKTILVFFFLGFAIIVGWSAMFSSMVYRWIFLQWPFLAGCSVCSFVLIVSSTALAIVCRLNFGRGLKQYLHAEAALAKSGFAPEVFRHDEEKNAPFDLATPDFKKSSFSPTSPDMMKYEQAMPTYLVPSLPHSRSGSVATNGTQGQQADAPGAPFRVPRLAERMSVQGATQYGVKYGESF